MKKLAALLTIFLFAGCVSRPTSMIASTSPLPPGVRGTIPTKGTNCQYFLLGLIPVTGSPDSASALSRAKKKADVDVLTDVTVDYGGGWYLLFSNTCVRVNGLGVPRSKMQELDLL